MDYCLSGFSSLCFSEAIDALSKPEGEWQPNRLQAWSKMGVTNESFFGKGASISDAFEVLEFDYDVIERMSYHLQPDVPIGQAKCICDLYRCPNIPEITGISGPAFSLDDIESRKWLLAVLKTVARTTSSIVTVANEDDKSLVINAMPLVMIPTTLVASCFPLPNAVKKELSVRRVILDEEEGLVTIATFKDSFRPAVQKVIADWLRKITKRQIDQ